VLTVSVAAALCFFNSIAASVGLLFSSASKDHNVVRHELIAHRGTLVGITGYLVSDMALRVAAVATLGSALDEYAIEAALAVWGGAVGVTFVARTFQHGPGACQSAAEGGDLVSGAVGLAYAGLRAWLDAMARTPPTAPRATKALPATLRPSLTSGARHDGADGARHVPVLSGQRARAGCCGQHRWIRRSRLRRSL